jgi:hypothetical protein
LRNAVAAAVADIALVLAADASGSVSEKDIALQFRGYAEAITSSIFLNAVRSGRRGRIALAFFAWSSDEDQDLLVPWMLIDGISTARQFAETLLQAPGPRPGYTSISGGIDYASRLLAVCEFPSDRWVIDISGDGFNNDGRAATVARDEAIAAGITINGLPIVRGEAQIAAYYSENVVGGPGAFVTVAQDIASFRTAVLRKLITEIALR